MKLAFFLFIFLYTFIGIILSVKFVGITLRACQDNTQLDRPRRGLWIYHMLTLFPFGSLIYLHYYPVQDKSIPRCAQIYYSLTALLLSLFGIIWVFQNQASLTLSHIMGTIIIIIMFLGLLLGFIWPMIHLLVSKVETEKILPWFIALMIFPYLSCILYIFITVNNKKIRKIAKYILLSIPIGLFLTGVLMFTIKKYEKHRANISINEEVTLYVS